VRRTNVFQGLSLERLQSLPLVPTVVADPSAYAVFTSLEMHKVELRVDRTRAGLAFANIVTALLAIWAAKLINPQYHFRSPLPELCNHLVKNF
jgi:hypothetical protein